MIALKTQTPAYWQEEFVISVADLEYLHGLVVESGRPVSSDELVAALVSHRCHQEVEAIRGDLDKGKMYQPRESYSEGDTLLFPAFNFTIGTVTGSRGGHDPTHGEFRVIEVRFDKSGEVREFAAELTSVHSLNREDGDDGLNFLRELVSPQDLIRQYGAEIAAKLRQMLADTDLSGFVEHRTKWMVQELMADVHVGHLNIAEAVIDVAGNPVTATQLLRELDLPSEIDGQIQEFSLNAALDADERFDDVGWDGEVRWYLHRMEPQSVASPSPRLKLLNEDYDRNQITPGLLAIETEIDDEVVPDQMDLSMLEITPYTAQITLTYPHARSGTLPLSAHVCALFPRGSYQHTRVELIDGQQGETMVGWVNHEWGFVGGLGEWYSRHQIPAGGHIRLERSKQPGVVIVDFDRQQQDKRHNYRRCPLRLPAEKAETSFCLHFPDCRAELVSGSLSELRARIDGRCLLGGQSCLKQRLKFGCLLRIAGQALLYGFALSQHPLQTFVQDVIKFLSLLHHLTPLTALGAGTISRCAAMPLWPPHFYP